MSINNKELYNKDKNLNIEFFKIYKELSLLLSKTYFEKVMSEGLDSYKLKHLLDESFSLLDFMSTFSDENVSYEEFLQKIENHKHSEEVSDDFDIENISFDDIDKRND